MKTFLQKVAFVLLILLAAAAVTGLLAFRLIQHNIATRMHPPHLTLRPEPAVDLPYQTLDGQPRLLSSAKGKVVFLDLWGTWCIQCVAEMPTVQRLYDHYRNDPRVTFLIVSRLDTPSAVRSYARRNRFDLPFYTMNDEDIPKTMQLQQYPSTFLFAPDGTLAAKHVGAADWSDPSVISFIDHLKQQ